MKQTFTPEQVRKYGLKPYAIYGGKVASFKCEEVPGKVFDIDLLPGILMKAQNKAATD